MAIGALSQPAFHAFQPARVQSYSGGTSSQQELLRSGAVRTVVPKDVPAALSADGYKLLDVRPRWEWEKARVRGAVHVPLFVEDTDASPLTLLKKWIHFGYIGLWTGQLLTTINPRFLDDVEAAVGDKDDKLLVACGEGLRSRIAVAALHKDGYRNVSWLAGGFNRVTERDFDGLVEGTGKLQYATVGGVSYFFLQLLLLLRAVRKEG